MPAEVAKQGAIERMGTVLIEIHPVPEEFTIDDRQLDPGIVRRIAHDR